MNCENDIIAEERLSEKVKEYREKNQDRKAKRKRLFDIAEKGNTKIIVKHTVELDFYELVDIGDDILRLETNQDIVNQNKRICCKHSTPIDNFVVDFIQDIQNRDNIVCQNFQYETGLKHEPPCRCDMPFPPIPEILKKALLPR